jgi:type VI secretion system protein ImpF
MSGALPGPRVRPGSLPPLFERLIDMEPREGTNPADALRLRDNDLRLTVARAIGQLLDTRRNVALEEAAEAVGLTVIDFGIPDFGTRAPSDERARALLAEAIRRAILAFEPRLQHPAVMLKPKPGEPSRLDVEITAILDDGVCVEPVSFRRGLAASGAAAPADAVAA